ncbi:MAG TPA: hypothetical protein VHL08_10220 [Dongiaceae bacterium]|jgi:hypothetical protein|nr:hypothetical protein [Dongiaceae bacterium]
MRADAALYQIYFDARSRSALDPAFLPYDNQANPRPEWREYFVFLQAYAQGLTARAPLTGFFSWRFSEKTGISGAEFRDFIAANPGYDAYVINPFPQDTAHYWNAWVQGDEVHPDFLVLAEQVLAGAGRAADLRNEPDLQAEASYCNFWAGTAEFWHAYMAYTRPVHDFIESGASPELRAKLWAETAHETAAPTIPFLMERLFTLFVRQSSFRVLPFRYSEQQQNRKAGFPLHDLYEATDLFKRLYRERRDESYKTLFTAHVSLLRQHEFVGQVILQREHLLMEKIRRKSLGATLRRWLGGAR